MRQGRTLILLGAAQFMVSVTLLLIASTSRHRPSLYLGLLDVTLVLTLVVTAALLHKAASGQIGLAALQHSYTTALCLSTALILMLWVFRDGLVFNTLLPGLAWRTFVFLYALPAALTSWRPVKNGSDKDNAIP